MKRGIVFMLSLCMLMLCGLNSCEKENEQTSTTKEDLLVGKWKSTKVEYQEYKNGKLVYEESEKCVSWYIAFDFRDNGTGSEIIYEDGESYLDEISSWIIMGENLILKYEDGEAGSMQIEEISENSMVLKFVDEYSYDGIKYEDVTTYYFTKI
ncbi:MAG: lipocalin family protein [Bacteroidales bacterium]|nr:lipocalin family protein [Bacteroidales bacterium]